MGDADALSSSEVSNLLTSNDELLGAIHKARRQRPDNQRLIVGIVGAPASGKSTLAEHLASQINDGQTSEETAVVVPMDGFHLDNCILDKFALRAVKGAPHTFDVIGLRSLLKRLAAPLSTLADNGADESGGAIYIPVFDRAMDLARCAGSSVQPHHRIVLLEGNYLLLNRPVWSDLAAYLNLSVFLDVPEQVLEQRLVQRWLDHGHSPENARQRALSNDIPNAHVVTHESATAHLRIKSVRQ